MKIIDYCSFYVSFILYILGFSKMGEDFGPESRSFECGYLSFDRSQLILLILVFLSVLGLMVFQISGHCKSLKRICVELNKRLVDDNPNMKSMEVHKGNVEKVFEKGIYRDGTSVFARKNSCCICKGCLVCEHGKATGDFSVKDLLDDGKNEVMDLGKDCFDNLDNASEEDEQETDLLWAKKAIRIERGYRAAAYLELEKERKAAASASNEAMTMILRIQNEKNSIEMQARQYRRVAEQKQIYDQEVIQSLQEIISKQELERRFLEEQLEVYKQKFLGRCFCNERVEHVRKNERVEEEKRDETRLVSNVEQKFHVSQFGHEADAHFAANVDSNLMSNIVDGMVGVQG